ncbi:MAG: hypothetical protein ACTTH7_09635, partial [Treponema sp.]
IINHFLTEKADRLSVFGQPQAAVLYCFVTPVRNVSSGTLIALTLLISDSVIYPILTICI